jgi:hypothetical protein
MPNGRRVDFQNYVIRPQDLRGLKDLAQKSMSGMETSKVIEIFRLLTLAF